MRKSFCLQHWFRALHCCFVPLATKFDQPSIIDLATRTIRRIEKVLIEWDVPRHVGTRGYNAGTLWEDVCRRPQSRLSKSFNVRDTNMIIGLLLIFPTYIISFAFVTEWLEWQSFDAKVVFLLTLFQLSLHEQSSCLFVPFSCLLFVLWTYFISFWLNWSIVLFTYSCS